MGIILPNKRGPQGVPGAASDVPGPEGPQGIPGTTRRVEFYSGATNASGLYTVTFPTAFPAAPHVSVVVPGATTEQFSRLVSVSTTGFTVHVFQRAGLTVLTLTLLALATTNVNGATVNVMVTER